MKATIISNRLCFLVFLDEDLDESVMKFYFESNWSGKKV